MNEKEKQQWATRAQTQGSRAMVGAGQVNDPAYNTRSRTAEHNERNLGVTRQNVILTSSEVGKKIGACGLGGNNGQAERAVGLSMES